MDDAFRDEGVGTMKLMPLIYAGLMLPILNDATRGEQRQNNNEYKSGSIIQRLLRMPLKPSRETVFELFAKDKPRKNDPHPEQSHERPRCKQFNHLYFLRFGMTPVCV